MDSKQPATLATAEDKPGCASVNGSAAALKAEISALKEERSKFWWHDRPNNGDLQSVLVLLDKLAAVTERIEKQMPPNSVLSNPCKES